jgi:transcriptional regulator with XRE-family HTH domain
MKKRTQEADEVGAFFGEVLRRERNAVGMTQTELSAATLMNASTLSLYENGMRLPDLLSLRRLASALPGIASVVLDPLPTKDHQP